MLKELLNQKGITIYQLSKQTEIPYSTLNDIINSKVPIENCRAGILHKLSSILNISMDELYNIVSCTLSVYNEKYNIHGTITVKSKKYFLDFTYQNTPIHTELHKVNTLTSFYIKEIALWEMEDIISEKEMEESWHAICINAKR